jgi:Cdc6-like AAA superfamily ATPase
MPSNTVKSKDQYAHRTHIKDVYIELPDYQFNHSPLYNGTSAMDEKAFLGRKKITNRLLNILRNSGHKNSGSYLITGYRGMGKTSLVKKVISDYKKEQAKHTQVATIEISFAQSNLNETDILKQITDSLIQISESKTSIRIWKAIKLGNLFKVLALMISFCFYMYFFFCLNYERLISQNNTAITSTYKTEVPKSIASLTVEALENNKFSWSKPFRNTKLLVHDVFRGPEGNRFYSMIFFMLFAFLFCLTLTYFILISKEVLNFLRKHTTAVKSFRKINMKEKFNLLKGSFDEYTILKRLKLLSESSNAAITDEDGVQSISEQIPFGFIQRKLKKYEIKNSKEIENELIQIFREYALIKNRSIKFIVVFDELDKVEPALGKGFYDEEIRTGEQNDFSRIKANEVRNRKKQIVNILASLKYFITTADAKFIFIAGREMFDAALADITDRESFISSIFHHVIYLDSFLKDKSDTRTGGITDIIDDYLATIILPPSNTTYSPPFLRNFHTYLQNISIAPEEIEKIIFTLQSFITYLTYRSNGSPKKMVKIVEEHIVECPEGGKKGIQIITSRGQSTNPKLYLGITYSHQYRFGFINYMFRPFILSQSQSITKYSDTVLVSTQYLIDHILKFHAFAFSIDNLELIPEIITSSKNPLFRQYIKEVIAYLQKGHISETELGLFKYKFKNTTANEVAYLSKIFEDESAAFNFSLDETFHIKQYIINKIKNLHKSQSGTYTAVHENSISFLYQVLGDTQYFDQEYDDAAVSFQEAIQYLNIEGNDYRNEVAYLRLKLKLGLVYEKRKNDELALAEFNSAKKHILEYKMHTSDSNTELCAVWSLVFSACLYQEEKVLVEGVKPHHLADCNQIFPEDTTGGNLKLVIADHFNDIGTLLYYKNYVPSTSEPNISIDQLELNRPPAPTVRHHKDYRASIKSLEAYSTALKIILDVNFTIPKELVALTAQNLFSFENVYNKSILKITAHTLSNIGDVIYSFFNKESTPISSSFRKIIETWKLRGDIIQFAENFTHNNSTAVPANLIELIHHHGDLNYLNKLRTIDRPMAFWDLAAHQYLQTLDTINYQTLDFVLISYYLSARYYFKMGKTASYCFQLRKILQVIRMSFRFATEDKNSNKDLIMFCEETLFTMIVEGANFNSSSTDRIQNEMYKNIFKVKPEDFNSSFYLNLSNSAEIKEAVLLIAQLKVRNYDKDDAYKEYISDYQLYHIGQKAGSDLKELTLITPYNSVSSQYVRMMELDLQEKINSVIGLNFEKENTIKESQGSSEIDQPTKEESKDNTANEVHASSSIDNPDQENGEHGTTAGAIDQPTKEENKDNTANEVHASSSIDKPDQENGEHGTTAGAIDQPTKEENKDNTAKEVHASSSIDKPDQENGVHGTIAEAYEQLVASSIITVVKLLNIMNVYEEDPYINNSYRAYFHRKLGIWLEKFEKLKDPQRDNISKILKEIVGKDVTSTLDSKTHFQLALLYYRKAVQFHSNGLTYHQFIAANSYLESDYDDEHAHFGAAAERHKINSEKIRQRIKEMEVKLKESKFFIYDRYLAGAQKSS